MTDDFDGSTYDRDLDHASLKSNLDAIRDEMLRDGSWRTADAIAAGAGVDPRGAVKERIRDLRKAKFGGYNVETQRTTNPRIWEYRLAGRLQTPDADIPSTLEGLTGLAKGIALVEARFPAGRRPPEVQELLELGRSVLGPTSDPWTDLPNDE